MNIEVTVAKISHDFILFFGNTRVDLETGNKKTVKSEATQGRVLSNFTV